MSDPLLKAIADYRAGLAAYSATPDVVTNALEQEVIACTYGPPRAVLNEWKLPAQSLAEVHQAIRVALDEGVVSDVQERMLEAALGFFEEMGGANG
ncbi:hypothetical protein ASD04_14815 [Devosia sp. Root436]|uniref:hypothetical protein n=1 Tax=Devosia sp. Root436 TaxID=1736537 RepID=UPI0006FA8261|nr:hypothetical protein [Devosia sp. Root436]KQX35310.1 hypothetical protein ASD04_14815 [Devosia sp. Root436]